MTCLQRRRSLLALGAALIASGVRAALADSRAAEEQAALLVAAPQLVDPNYAHTVLLVLPVSGDRHIGMILNRPTRRSLASLFPDHAPSRKVVDPVYFGGPMAAEAVAAVVRSESDPGGGSIELMSHLYFCRQVDVVDRVIEAMPNDARYYLGFVEWRAGELREELRRDLWLVLDPDPGAVFRKNPRGMWRELLGEARAINAGTRGVRAARVTA